MSSSREVASHRAIIRLPRSRVQSYALGEDRLPARAFANVLDLGPGRWTFAIRRGSEQPAGRYFGAAMNGLTKISEHVYWMPPGPPDRPSLCAVVGDRHTLMLDAGSSAAHASAFLVGLLSESRVRPSAVVYTHSHWDHVLGGAEVDGLVIAHALTAESLVELAERDWSDDGLERRLAAGLSSLEHVENVKAELPPPRAVEVVPADIVFHDRIEVDLGRVTVHVHHVGGDHSADSSLMFVEPDAVLFLGDCMYPSPEGALTAESAFRLRDVILGFDADHHVEGHHESVSSRTEMESLFEKMELAEDAVREGSAIPAPDEDTQYFVQSFSAGRTPAQ